MLQRKLSDWPTGLCEDLALINLTPLELGRRANIAFTQDHDDLDTFDASLLEMSTGELVALQHYHHAPVSGTKLVTYATPPKALAETFQSLRLVESDLSWVSPLHSNTVRSAFDQSRKAAGKRRLNRDAA